MKRKVELHDYNRAIYCVQRHDKGITFSARPCVGADSMG